MCEAYGVYEEILFRELIRGIPSTSYATHNIYMYQQQNNDRLDIEGASREAGLPACRNADRTGSSLEDCSTPE
ncbi:MAG: hypothetical protein QXQ57_08045 [Sulfolobales archaeon]